MNFQKTIPSQLKIETMFQAMGFDYKTMEINKPYEINEEFEILSFDENKQENVWSKISKIIRKEDSVGFAVMNAQTNEVLFVASPEHAVYAKTKSIPESRYFELMELLNEEGVFVLNKENLWEEVIIHNTQKMIPILDMEVESTNNYFSNNIVSHNTMFGDPTTTPGGMAIPYACSTRVSITSSGQKQVKDKLGNIIGIHVTAKTIKNKIAPPFRSVQFQIIFGHGIVEHKEVFDAFREHCSKEGAVEVTITPEDKKEKPYTKLVSVEGTGAWKMFTIANGETGEIETEIKFYKPDFGEKVLYVPEYKQYMDALFEAAFVVSPTHVKDHATYEGIDSESYTEHAQLLIDQAEQDVLARESEEID
jgi:hypothetical protein